MGSETQSIELPLDLINRIEQRVQLTNFESTEEYIAYVLEEMIFEVEQKNTELTSEKYDDQQETEVEERLKSLGYLSREK